MDTPLTGVCLTAHVLSPHYNRALALHRAPSYESSALLLRERFGRLTELVDRSGNTTYRLNYLRDCWREEGGN